MTLDDENYSNLSKILSSAMNDQCQGKEADFMCKMDAMWPMFSSAMSSCTETNRWYNDVEQFYKEFESNPEEAEKTQADNYSVKKAVIDDYASQICSWWNQGVFFNSGMALGETIGELDGYPTLDL